MSSNNDVGITKIYGLWDPRNSELRYIGKTKHSLSTRLSQHVSEAKKLKETHRHKWILSIIKDGYYPCIDLLEECTEENWEEVEQAWISDCKRFGVRLTNLTDGGNGLIGYKLSQRHIEALRLANLGNTYCLGFKHTEETKKKMGASRKGKKHKQTKPCSLETRRKRSEAGKGRKLTEEAKEKIRVSRLGKPRSEETKEKLRKANLGKHPSAETRLKMSKAHSNPSPETRAKLSKGRLGNKNRLGISHSEEVRLKIGEASKKSWAKRKAQKLEN